MTSPEKQILKEIAAKLKSQKDFLLLGHHSADGDSLGSMIALGRFLKFQLKKNVVMPCPEKFPPKYSFLKPAADFEQYNPDTKYSIIAFDCSDSKRLDFPNYGEIKEIDILIDHHQGEPDIGYTIYKDTSAPAAGLLVFRLLKFMDCNFTPEIAEAIYTAILTDTGQFAFSGTNEECFETASFLVKQGTSPEKIAKEVYWNHPMTYISNMRTALNNLEFFLDGQLSIISLTQKNIESKELLNQTEGIVDLGIMIEGVQIALLLREMEDENIRVSLRSRVGYDVSEIARSFEGGGQINAAGCSLFKTIDIAKTELIKTISPIIQK